MTKIYYYRDSDMDTLYLVSPEGIEFYIPSIDVWVKSEHKSEEALLKVAGRYNQTLVLEAEF